MSSFDMLIKGEVPPSSERVDAPIFELNTVRLSGKKEQRTKNGSFFDDDEDSDKGDEG
jgi:hypothetical protein